MGGGVDDGIDRRGCVWSVWRFSRLVVRAPGRTKQDENEDERGE